MTSKEIHGVFAAALSAAGVNSDDLEVRVERNKQYSLFYNDRLLGLYNHRYKRLKTENIVYYTDEMTPKELGNALAAIL